MKRTPTPLRSLVIGLLLPLVVACSTPTASQSPPPATSTSRLEPGSSPTAPADSTPGAGDPAALPAYTATIRRLGPALRERMQSSHGPGCPLRWRDLRYLQVSYVGFDATPRVGELVVHRRHARAIVEVFEKLYAAAWPIKQMRLVDDFGGDDDRSMAANNTSAYNCRPVAGSDSWSQHAYGAAIDLNPVHNPYVQGTAIAPPAGRRFAAVDRSPGADGPPGAIHAADVVVGAFAAIGWEWGGNWSSAKDYQHFSASGD
jgi:hypothetical protein